MGWWTDTKNFISRHTGDPIEENIKKQAAQQQAVNKSIADAETKKYQDYYAATAANEAAAQQGIQAQLSAAKQAADWAQGNIGTVQQQNADIAKAARRRMAAALSGVGSRFESGGARSAQMTQQGADIAGSEAAQRVSAAQRMLEANQAAQQAQSQYGAALSESAAESQKLREAQMARQEQDASLISQAQDAIKDIAGYYASGSDMQEAANKLEREYLPKAQSPQARAQLQQTIAQLRAGTYNVKGAIQF